MFGGRESSRVFGGLGSPPALQSALPVPLADSAPFKAQPHFTLTITVGHMQVGNVQKTREVKKFAQSHTAGRWLDS